jgi:hypothetical protein
MKIKIFFAWYDFWIGFYFDRHGKALYFCPLPCVVIKIYRHYEFTNSPIPEPSVVQSASGRMYHTEPFRDDEYSSTAGGR